MRRRITLTLMLGLLIALSMVWPSNALARSTPLIAATILVNTEGDTAGFARFIELPSGRVLVLVVARDLTPGMHGLHIHTTGTCTPSFADAGGHFNPLGTMHGAHAGDLGNILANPSGHAGLLTSTTQFTLSEGQFSLFDADGSALVIHAGTDDLVTDPAGNSGARVACGVIRRVQHPG